jgi:hypothetical protein
MNMSTKILKSLVFSLGVAFFYACSGGNSGEENNAEGTKDTSNKEKVSHAQIVLYNIPSPLETSQLLKEAGAKYDGVYTNPISNTKEYKSSESKALNLGVYAADLCYAGVFENAQESMSFLKSVNSLSGDLGVGSAFNENTADRIEKNKKNKDSVMSIISEAFWEADSYLKENNRSGVSSLLISGGWIEAIFISSKIYQKTKSEKIKNRIVSQPQANALNSIIAMLQIEKLNPETQTVLDGLKKLNESFNKISSSKTETKSTTDEAAHKTKLETSGGVNVTDELLAEIIKGIDELRSKVIGLK